MTTPLCNVKFNGVQYYSADPLLLNSALRATGDVAGIATATSIGVVSCVCLISIISLGLINISSSEEKTVNPVSIVLLIACLCLLSSMITNIVNYFQYKNDLDSIDPSKNNKYSTDCKKNDTLL